MNRSSNASEANSSKDLSQCRRDFPSLEKKVASHSAAYFDGPGGTQVPSQVIDVVVGYYEGCNANVHGAFVTSQETDEVLEQARKASAVFLNASSFREISFGANMTTLNFFLSSAIGRQLNPGDEVLITQLDHEANRGPWLRLREKGVHVREVAMTPDGILNMSDLDEKIGERTRVVAVGWASNALGTVNDLYSIRRKTKQVGAWMVVDAVHYAPHFPIDVQDLGPDFLLCSAYKFYGPHVGLLYSRQNLLGQLDTDRLWTQETEAPYRIETGTLNHASIAGVTAAVNYISSFGEKGSPRHQIVTAMTSIARSEHRLAVRLYKELRRLKGVQLFGPPFERGLRAPTISFRIDKRPPSKIATFLGKKGIFVWDGDFYAARAVEVLGLAEKGGLIRVGMSMYNNDDEVDRLLDAVVGLV